MAKKPREARQGRFVVYTFAKTGTGRTRTLARFHRRDAARSFARAESIARESLVYVDEELGRGRAEPIATFSSGQSLRI